MTDIIINAWWWRGKRNLGDLLTPYIIERLSGKKCRNIGYKWTTVLKYILSQIKNRRHIKKELLSPIYYTEPEYILGVGSILNHASDGKAIAWGCGFLKQDQLFTGKKVVAVRGKYSADKLVEQGYPRVEVLGDPALLLPLVYHNRSHKNGKIAIIPHYREYKFFVEKYGKQYDVISMDTDDIEGTIDKICSYNYLLSSSLHGIIIGQAYKIPVLWIEDKPLDNDLFHFKFRDYFSSVGINYYDPFKNVDDILNGNIPLFFKNNETKVLINKDLNIIQRDLLKVAPFYVLPKF